MRLVNNLIFTALHMHSGISHEQSVWLSVCLSFTHVTVIK